MFLATPLANDAPGFHHFVGALQEHSGYSDGTIATQPRDYFAAVRVAGHAG